MKKILFGLLLLVSSQVKAEGLSDQFLAAITKDMAAVVAHTSHGTNKAEFLTSLIQVGHFNGEYILGLDAGVIGASDSIRKTYGVHLHLTPFVIANVPMNIDLKGFLSHVELTPRWSFDEDSHSGVLSYVFGAKFSY